MAMKAKTALKEGMFLVVLLMLLISPLAFLWLSHADSLPSASIDDLIEVGKTQISQKSTVGVQSAYVTFQEANTKYDSATTLQKIKIRMYLAATRLMDFATRKEGATEETLATFMGKYGVTYTGTNPDDLNLIVPLNGQNKVTLPAVIPSNEALRSFLTGRLMDTLNASLADMDAVIALLGSEESKEIVSKMLIAPDDPSQLSVEIDDGDYYLFRAGLKGAKAMALAMSAYNINIDLKEVAALINSNHFNFNDLLNKYPNLLTILTTGGTPSCDGAAKLAEARLLLISAIDDYMIASDKIRNDVNTTAGAQEFLYITDAADLADEQKFRDYLSQLRFSLTDAAHPAAVLDLDGGEQLQLNLNPVFGNGSGPLSPRTLLPQFTDFAWGYPVAGTMGSGLGNDATLGGIFPGFTQDKWNGLFSDILLPTGLVDIPAATITVDGNTADWAGISPVLVDTVQENEGVDPGRDVSRLFIARDETNYYFRMDTFGNRADSGLIYDYVVKFTQTPDGSSMYGDRRVLARYDPETVWTITTEGGTIVEIRLSNTTTPMNTVTQYATGSFTVLQAGTESPALPASGTFSDASAWIHDNNLSIDFSNLDIDAIVDGSTITSGTLEYTSGNTYSCNINSGVQTFNARWYTYLQRYYPGIGWNWQDLGANMSMGLGETVEWKIPLATLGDISGAFIAAETYPWTNSNNHEGDERRSTGQAGPLAALGKISGTLTVPGYDGTGMIYLSVYPADTGFNTDTLIAVKMISPEQYSAGMAYSFDNLPVGLIAFVAVHWDRNGNGLVDADDYTGFSTAFLTTSAGTTPVFSASTVFTPWPAPVLTSARVRKTIGSSNPPYSLFVFVPGISPEDITVTATGPDGNTYTLTPTFFLKQVYGQLYMYRNTFLPNGEYTFEAIDKLGRRAAPVKVTFADYDGVPAVDPTTIRVNGNPVSASNYVFYTNADPATTPIDVSWTAPGAGYVYRVQVYDMNGNIIYYTTNIGSELTNTFMVIPAGLLQPETPYALYVETSDPNHPGNAALAARGMYTGSQPTPAFSFANIVEQPPYYFRTQYLRKVMFTAPGVMPGEIISLRIKDSGNNVVQTFSETPVTEYRFDGQSFYSYSVMSPANLPDGNYTLEATISRGGAQTVITSGTIAFNYATVPTVAFATLSPGDNYYFTTTTPTFSWTGVAGTYYRLQIFDTKGNVNIYSSAWDTGKISYSAEVPANVLLRGAGYYWTVQSANTSDPFDVYNYALFGTESDDKNMNRFTVLKGADVNASVTGVVTNELSAVQPGALVEALVNDVVVAFTFADFEGKYWLNLPKNTSYTIRVSVDGYSYKSITVVLADIDLSGQNIAFGSGDIDASVPTISNLSPGYGGNASPRPEISAIVTSSGASGIDASSIILYLDGVIVSHAYNPATGAVSFTPSSPLSDDFHTVMLGVSNNAGQSAWTSWYFEVSDETLYATYPDGGIWKNDGSEWSQITTDAPGLMATSGTDLYATFPPSGIWKYNGTNWSQVTSNNPDKMVVSGTTLYGTFGISGVWKYDGSDWSQVTSNNPDEMVIAGGSLYGTFGISGIWKYDGSDWSQVTTNTPQKMVGSTNALYGIFEGSGIWKYEGTEWNQVTTNTPEQIISGGTNLYGTFAGSGIWKYNGTDWANVTPNNPQQMTATSTALYGVFTGTGIWKHDGTTWSQVTANDPLKMVAGE